MPGTPTDFRHWPRTGLHRGEILDPRNSEEPSTYREELRTFLFLTIVMAPALAVIVVGGYGFIVWMYQLITGDLPG